MKAILIIAGLYLCLYILSRFGEPVPPYHHVNVWDIPLDTQTLANIVEGK